MQSNARDLHESTGAFRIPLERQGSETILDLCMAPGGFLRTAMRYITSAHATAFTLPVSDGGHHILLEDKDNVTIKLLDITMLAEDIGMSIEGIPKDHPDRSKFLPRQLPKHQNFDLVFCDGQVLRTQERAAYREQPREARRLGTGQLVIALEHIRPGGTMVVLLHGVDEPRSATLLHQFSKFASLKLFKPTKSHAARSSFYMIATNIEPEHDDAVAAVKDWKRMWEIATFAEDEEYDAYTSEHQPSEETLVAEFGKALVTLGKEVWSVQAKALGNSWWVTGDVKA
jgi:23S rRNA U2552 (ribose-2'-O)-methylase RlmE/FtsJ